MLLSINKLGFNFQQTTIKLVLMVLTLTCMLSLSIEDSRAATVLSLETARDYEFGIWANAGSLSATQSLCAVAWEDKNNQARNYHIRTRNLMGSGGFYLYLDGDNSATGTSRIEIQMSHADISDSNSFETLLENVWESQKQRGQSPGCPNGPNSALRVNIDSMSLANKLGGDYIGHFQATIREGGSEVDSIGTFAVSITIGGVPQVQISHLDSIDFGAHTGRGDLSASESFCIYSSAPNGAYRLSISSAGQDANGHYLEELSGTDRIPLTVLYANSGTGPGTTPITNNYVYGNGDSINTNCSGNDNTTLTLRLAEADLQTASTGRYSGQITILVEPE